MKSLIIYTSITKNTEQVAYTFGSVFEAFGIETTYAKVLPKYKGGEISEYYPEDYGHLSDCKEKKPGRAADVFCGREQQPDYSARDV